MPLCLLRSTCFRQDPECKGIFHQKALEFCDFVSPSITICKFYMNLWQGSTVSVRFYFPSAALLCLHADLQVRSIPDPARCTQQAPKMANCSYPTHHNQLEKTAAHCPLLVSCKKFCCLYIYLQDPSAEVTKCGFKLIYVPKSGHLE